MRDRIAGISEATEPWLGPAVLGVSAAILLWVVWYFTKAPCTMESAKVEPCNIGVVARFINHQILAQCILLGIAVAAAKGGYNEIMLNRERKRAEEERQRAEEERRRADEAEARLEEERKQSAQRTAEERERIDTMLAEHRADRQAMMAVMAQISDTLVQLLARQQNGQSPPQN